MVENLKNAEESVSFDDVLKDIGSNGRYQKFFNIFFVMLFSVATSAAYNNIIVVLSAPDHWCHIPKPNGSNTTQEEWKSMFIPKTYDAKGTYTYDKCKMYNVSVLNNSFEVDYESTIDCKWGWEYDKTWFERTIISDEDWVCDRDIYAANSLAFSRIAEILGSLIFGYCADNFGRKPVWFGTTLLIMLGRFMLLFSVGRFTVFIISVLISSFTSMIMMVSALTIGIEITTAENSALVTMLQANGWALGLCVINLMMWYLRDWTYLISAICVSCLVYLLVYRWVIESPRWLVSKHKVDKSIKILKIIAKVNGTSLPQDADVKLTILSNRKSENYSFAHFFANRQISRNTICLIICWSSAGVAYFTLVINALNLGDNIFLAAFWQAFAEIPSNILGMWVCNRFGRRFTQTFSHSATVLTGVALILTITNENLSFFNIVLASLMKFLLALSIYTLFVHTAELYPTYLRQSAITMGTLTICISAIVSPYLVHLGTKVDARYPFAIISAYAVLSTACTLLLPETVNQQLPETLQETQELSERQSLFRKNVNENKSEIKSVK